MEVKTYRARSMQEALNLVRRDLGPEAAILHTREVHGGPLVRWVPGLRKIEVTAALDVLVPSRMPPRETPTDTPLSAPTGRIPSQRAAVDKAQLGGEVQDQLAELSAMVEDLCRRAHRSGHHELPEELFSLYTELIDAELGQDHARELVERVRSEVPAGELSDPALVRARVARLVEDDIRIAGPIAVTPGRSRLVALVGPTGVGKTTTIAKLAATFRLRDRRRVGLITVDTYRIAAVEQLRTYADIIDLPMQVVSTPREMRAAVERMADLDLVLLDTAGRSPTDDIRIQELRAFLSEAAADEVHLVLSSVASAAALEKTARRFTEVGATALVLTKLDEASGLGNLLPLLRASRLPLSYLTDGQNVPDDIEPAEAGRLARLILGGTAAVRR